ncbi:transcription-repair coupling factor [Cytophagaceae bacterium ABcell3]|nr:transcription-repair coupling factor [Cytophagaceae bacterium ABcell3]
MKAKDLINIYKEDLQVKTLANKVENGISRLRLKGLIGSLDSVISATLYTSLKKSFVFVLHEKEEAFYFQNDLQGLLPDQEVLLFPASYKKAWKYEETDNANVVMRAEVLNRLNDNPHAIIVTYPEALTEKVINKKSLIENTFKVNLGDKLDINFLSELLTSYNFEIADFVYEAGQFAIRGGIIDIFSFANDLPYRLELFDDEVESIRIIDPETQLSVENKKSFSLIPNVQEKLSLEVRESFLDFIPSDSILWFKDIQHALDTIEKQYEGIASTYEEMQKTTGNSALITKPEILFETKDSFEKAILKLQIIEFGRQFKHKNAETYEFNAGPQPSFNKDFNLLSETLRDYQEKNYTNIIVSDSHQQLDRLTAIFEEIDPFLKFNPLNLSLREGFTDEENKITCFTDHQIFERYHRYKTKERQTKSKSITLKELKSLSPGDYITHQDYGIGRFAGLEKVDIGGKQQEAIRLIYRDDDVLLISIHSLHKISKYSAGEGPAPSMSKLGSGDWEAKKKKAKSRVKDIAKELISLYARRKAAPGYAYSKDGYLQAELESSFIYEDTPDQAKATADVKQDMEQPHPMDRLVCGDVGFGKTEVAIRAAFKAVCDSKQVAVLVPTTILAMQHYKTFKSRLENLPCTIEYVNRFKTTQQIKETLKRVAEGKTNILIGTHRLISKDIKFKDLGLLVIDEEQKFGVKVKEKLKELRVNVDTLTLTATPIPRTLHFSLMGARDLSVIATPPPNRQPVTTEIHVFNDEVIRDAVSNEIKRGGQVFFVHNRIKDLEEVAYKITKLVPDAKVAVAHGQMEGEKLEKIMMKFVDGEYDILVSTNIIESGLDIPNANTIIINRAHMFGLSDLHQMRGRVGRSNKKAFCYLLTPPAVTLPADSRKRLGALEEFSDLGDGFKVAMRDLDIRGAGNLLGAEQTGFINDLGFEMYHKILDEAISELKETEFKELFSNQPETDKLKDMVSDCVIETDLAVVIPDQYVTNISERLSLYNTLDNIKSDTELQKFKESLIDRFGPMPPEVEDLTKTVELRWMAQKLGFEKLMLKNDALKAYFGNSDNEEYFQSETFGNILSFVQSNPKKCRLKEANKKPMVIINDVTSIEDAIEILENISASKEVSIK